MAKKTDSGGLSLGTIFEIVMVVLNSTKNKEPGKDGKGGGMTIDQSKLGWGLAGIAGQQSFKWFLGRREKKQLEREYASGLINLDDFKVGKRAEKAKKKSSRFGVGLVVGSLVGAATYLMALPPEQRTRFFQQLDRLVTQVVGFVNELQGKPYSQDYEK